MNTKHLVTVTSLLLGAALATTPLFPAQAAVKLNPNFLASGGGGISSGGGGISSGGGGTSLPDYLLPPSHPESPAWLPSQEHVNEDNQQSSLDLHGLDWLIEHGGGEFIDGGVILKYKGTFDYP